MAFEDLIGGSPTGPTGTMGDAVESGLRAQAEAEGVDTAERDLVTKLQEEYKAARSFDEWVRKKYAKDRSYASGKALQAWYSTANLIASFIDILVSFLYAKNPDVSVRPARQVVLPKELPPPAMPGALPTAGGLPGALPAAAPPVPGMAPAGAEGGLGDAIA